jgi:hypothetical protein
MIERHWNADLLAKIFGVVFLAVGLLGFAPNPIVSPTGVFEVNEAHNIVHIATGVAFLAGAMLGAPVITIRVIAVLYALVAIIGFVMPGSMLLNIVAINMADRWLHAVLAAVLLLVGFLAPAPESMRHARM